MCSSKGVAMRFIALIFSLLLFSVQSAFAVITWTPGGTVAGQNIGTPGTTATFTNAINNGTNIPAGSFACFAFVTNSGFGSIGPLTYTIGGNSATVIETDIASTWKLALICASIPSSATDSIVISGTNNFGIELVAGGFFTGSATTASAVGCSEYTFQNSESLMTIQSSCTGANTTITNPTGGYGLTAIMSEVGTAGTSCGTLTWSTTGSSNITSSTGDVNVCLNTHPNSLSLAHTTTAGSWGPSASSSPTFGSNAAMVAATFAVGAAAGGAPQRSLIGAGQ